jgi:hypothetical protein
MAGIDRTARLWRPSDGAAALAHRSDRAVLGVAFSPDTRSLAVTAVDGSVWLGPVDEDRLVSVAPELLHARLQRLTTARLLPWAGSRAPATIDRGLVNWMEAGIAHTAEEVFSARGSTSRAQ